MTEPNRQSGENEERIIEIEIERLRPFKEHPFQVKDDKEMFLLQESIEKYGILNPLIVRPVPDGYYEIISGHRRKHAAEKLGYRKVPVIIRVLSEDDSKHVICSCFDAYSGIDKVWNIHDVDPEGKGEVNLEINFDKECFMYYQAFVSYVDSLNQVYQCESVKNQKYYCWVYEDEKYCILEEIYNSMKSGQFNEQNRYRNFNNYVNEKLSDIEYPEQFSHDGISSYEDGIVVCSSVSWRDKLH